MVAQRFNRAVDASDEELVARMRDSIGARIEALDEFYLQNDDDEQNRGMLFEKQRLQLRRLLQSAASSSAASYASPAASPTQYGRSPVQRSSPGGGGSARRQQVSPRSARKQAELAYSTRSPTAKKGARLPWSPAQSGKGGGRKPGAATPKSGRKSGTPRRSQKPLYAWETGATIAKREPEEAAFAPEEAAMIQFRVMMTAKEYRAFKKTYRQKRAMFKHIQKNTPSKARQMHLAYSESQASINASGPFVDKRELERQVYRGDDREAWVDEGGFNLTTKALPIGEQRRS